MAQIPILALLKKKMVLEASDVNISNSLGASNNWVAADYSYDGTTTTTTTFPYSNLTQSPYSNVSGVVPSLTTSLSILGEEEIDKKINDALGKLDEHVDQLEGDIEFFNEERQKQEQKICHLEDENEKLKDECQALRDEVEELGNKIATLRSDLMNEETKIDSRIAWLETMIEELQSLKEKIK